MFDIDKLKNNRQKAKEYIKKSAFHKFIYTDIIDRLRLIDKDFSKILILDTIFKDQLYKSLKTLYKNSSITIVKIEELKIFQNKFDLIVFPFGMHWIFDVPEFLNQIKNIINTDGIFIGNFAGEKTLNNLRYKLIELEEKYTKIHIPHIIPFIKFEDITILLQNSGFKENIIDIENCKLECNSTLDFMKFVKKSGESNILKNVISYSITKNMYNYINTQDESKFIDIIDLITFTSSISKNTIKISDKYLNNINS